MSQPSSSSSNGKVGFGTPVRGKGVPDILPIASECIYSPFFCEENVWKLCEYMHLHCPDALQNAFVVFVSNEKRAVPLWRQRAGRTEDKLVIWDYHVVLLHSHDGRYLVYDLDSDLPFPTYFHKYVTETFRTDHILKPEYHRCFRVIPGISFLQDFSSDRSHMKKDGVWIKSPPEYPPIFEPERGNNLEEFISMNPGIPRGEILSLPDLVKKFHSFTTS